MKKETIKMPKLNFYDVKSKKTFLSKDYKVVTKSGKNFAVADSITGKHKCWRILSAKLAKSLK